MSTNKTLKRVALVAVASLGFGLVSVAPSNAAASSAFNFVTAEYSENVGDTATTVAGVSNYVEIKSAADTAAGDSVRITVSGAGAAFVDITEETDADNDWTPPAVSYNAGLTVATIAGTDLIGTDNVDTLTFRVNTPTAGTVTITVETLATTNGIQTATAEGTLTVSVNATATVGVPTVADSTVNVLTAIPAAEAGGAANISQTDATSPTMAISSGVAYLVTAVEDANGTALTSADLRFTASGPCVINSVATDNTIGTQRAKVHTATALTREIDNEGDGSDDVIVVQVAADGSASTGACSVVVEAAKDGSTTYVTLATKSITVYGAVATLTATASVYSLADSAGATVFATISATDANGVAVPIQAADGSPSTTNGTFADANNGSTKVDISLDPTADTLGTKSTTWTHTATSKTVVVSVVVSEALATGTQVTTMSTDKTSYVPGEKITITVSSVDASGNIMADGAGNYFTAAGVTSTTSLNGSLPAQAVTLENGSATYTAYAPLVSGDVTLSGTSAATAATVVTATFKVTGGTTEAAADAAKAAAAAAEAAAKKAGEDAVAAAKAAGDAAVAAAEKTAKEAVDAAAAAADAAAEAIDAANAATDAANLAAEAADAATVAAEEARDAADAATAAVEELATQVATLMAALKAQITTLGNTVAKIAKKVKA